MASDDALKGAGLACESRWTTFRWSSDEDSKVGWQSRSWSTSTEVDENSLISKIGPLIWKLLTEQWEQAWRIKERKDRRHPCSLIVRILELGTGRTRLNPLNRRLTGPQVIQKDCACAPIFLHLRENGFYPQLVQINDFAVTGGAERRYNGWRFDSVQIAVPWG